MRRATARLVVVMGCGLGLAAGLRTGGLAGRAGAPGADMAWAGGTGSAGSAVLHVGGPGPLSAGGAPPASPGRRGVPALRAPGGAAVAGANGGGAAVFAAAGRTAARSNGDTADPALAAASSGVIVVDGFEGAPGTVSAGVRGFDPGGPRALVMWRVDEGGATRLAFGFSDSTGSLHFPQIAEPADPLDLVVAPAGAPPPSHDASDPARTPGRTPLAPVVERVRAEAGGLVLRVGVREAGGAVLVASGDGTLLARFSLSATRGPTAHTVEITVAGGLQAAGLLVAQELPDGRRSSFEAVALPAGGVGAP